MPICEDCDRRGCYASGQFDGLEAWPRSLTCRHIISYLETVRIGGSGLISGGRPAARLQESVGKVSIENMPVRFAAFATEVGTGHEVWLARGSLALALRASYALPRNFPPVSFGGFWLVDGALVNPMPVSIARAFGARVVIAVNLNADSFGRGATIASQHGSDENDEEPLCSGREVAQRLSRPTRHVRRPNARSSAKSLPGARPTFSIVMVEAFNIMQDRLTRMRVAGDPPDVHITPRVGHISFLDFHRAADAIAVSQSAAEKALDSIAESIAELS